MRERRCPKCGAAVWLRGRDYAIYKCKSEAIEGEDLEETTQCLRNQLSQAKERIEELARERDELQAKLDDLLSKQTGTTPDSERGKGKCLTNEQEQMVADIERAERRRLK